MTVFSTNAPAGLAHWFSVQGLLSGLSAAHKRRKEENRVLRELTALSPRDLLDLDITPADFRRIAREAGEMAAQR